MKAYLRPLLPILALLAASLFGCTPTQTNAQNPPAETVESYYPDAELVLSGDASDDEEAAVTRGLATARRALPERPELLPPLQTLPKLYVKGATNGYSLTRTRINFASYPWAAFIRDNATHSNDLLQDVHIVCDPDGQSKWGIRDYGLVDSLRERVIVENVDAEHGEYDSVTQGRAIWRGCWYENCGAQGLQLRLTNNRGDAHWILPKEIELEDVTTIECGQVKGAGRAGFSISIKDQGPNATVSLRNIYVRTVRQSSVRTSGPYVYDSFGGVCVEYCKELNWRGGFVALKNPDRPAIQLYDYANKARTKTGPDVIHLRSVHVARAGNIAVRIGDGSMIDITACTGNGRILVYAYGADGVWRQVQSIPINQGFYWVKP